MNDFSKTSPATPTTVEIVHRAMEFIRKHEKDSNVCLGYAWGTFNSILIEHGLDPVTAPWQESAK